MDGDPYTATASLGLCCRTMGYSRDKEVQRMEFNKELRSLMYKYLQRQSNLAKEIRAAKIDNDVDAELTGEALHKQMRVIIAELFNTMKIVGALDSEEIEFGSLKKE